MFGFGRKLGGMAIGTALLAIALGTPGAALDPKVLAGDVILHGDCTGFANLPDEAKVLGFDQGMRSGVVPPNDPSRNEGLFLRFQNRDYEAGWFVYWIDGDTPDGVCFGNGAIFPAEEWFQYNSCLAGSSIDEHKLPPAIYCEVPDREP